MPGISGMQLAIQFQELCPDCGIILMSGAEGTALLLDDAVANGSDFEILAKPFHPTLLLDTINQGPRM